MDKIVIPKENISFSQCDMSALPLLLALQDKAIAHLEDASHLRKSPPELYEKFLTAPNYTLGAYYEGKLIAFGVLYAPEAATEVIAERMKKEDILTDVSDVVNLKIIICDYDYRGNGLQSLLMDRLEAKAKELGYNQICSTVSPDNVYSRRNFLKREYSLSVTFNDYGGGLSRELYFKNL